MMHHTLLARSYMISLVSLPLLWHHIPHPAAKVLQSRHSAHFQIKQGRLYNIQLPAPPHEQALMSLSDLLWAPFAVLITPHVD